jgi:hypothetical protein
MQRRRAAVGSVVGHGAFIALLTFIGTRSELPSFEAPLIVGELVTASVEPETSAAAIPPAPIAEQAEEPSHTPSERNVAEPTPALPEPEPQPETPDERALEPPAEPLPVHRLAELPQPDVELAAELPQSNVEPVAELPQPNDEPVAELPNDEPVAELPNDEPMPELARAPQPVAAEGLPAGEATADPADEPVRGLASHEERAVRKHLSSWTGHLGANETPTTLAWRDDGQDFKAVLKRVPATDAMGMEQLLVELTTQRDGRRLVADLRMNRIAFSNFAQFIDRWDPNVQIHDDLIDGRFHSNSEIRVSREQGVQPVFNGKVTIAAGDVRTDGVGFISRRTMFPGGIETRARRIVLPSRAAAFDEDTVPAGRLQRIARDSLLTFHDDGTFESHVLGESAGPSASGPLGDEPFYFVADDDVDLHVRGTVNGKVLVYSPGDIVIVDDLRYAADPRMHGADDYLGLVAERTVEVDEPDVTGPGDLTVHASIYARNRFAVRDYRSRRSGTLSIYGSVTAGTLSATEPRFATRIEFDDRLTTMRAPGFPLSDRYELDSASGEWRVLDAP